MASKSEELLSRIAAGDGHGENSSYFDGWKAYDENPFDLHHNRGGVIQMGLAENQLSLDLIEEWSKAHPEASICTAEGGSQFKRIANFQDYHGLPEFRQAMAQFMGQVRGWKARFDPDRVVMSGGATGAQETLAFCLANPGEAFLVPTPYYPGFDRDCCWRSGVKLLPIECHSSDDFRITEEAVVSAYESARSNGVRVKGILITNPSNPLGPRVQFKGRPLSSHTHTMSGFAAFRKEDTEQRISVRKDDGSLVLTPVKPFDKYDGDDTIRCVCVRNGRFLIEPSKVDDQSHQWFKYTVEGTDGEANPFFVLVNKASLSALTHDMQLVRFDPDNIKDDLMWTMLRGSLSAIEITRLDLHRYGFNGDKPSGAAGGDGPTNHPNEYPNKFFPEYPYGFNGDMHFDDIVGDGPAIPDPAKHPDGEPYWQRLRKRIQLAGIFEGGKEESGKRT